jgi:hypothetical protein
MDPTYLQALNGTLRSPEPTGTPGTIGFSNALYIPLNIFSVGTDGNRTFLDSIPASVPPEISGKDLTLNPDQYYVVTSAGSGAFALVFSVEQAGLEGNASLQVDASSLVQPGDIGPFPVPTQSQPIPPDSWPVVVGVGVPATGNPLAREQLWQRSQESYSLAPGETRTASVTSMHGLQDTTSDETTVQSSVSTSVSAGWGSISASISASLSQSSSHTHTVSIQSQQTKYVSEEVSNQNSYSIYFLKWDLVDRTIIYAAAGNVLATIVHKLDPTLIGGPYDQASLPTDPLALSQDRPSG